MPNVKLYRHPFSLLSEGSFFRRVATFEAGLLTTAKFYRYFWGRVAVFRGSTFQHFTLIKINTSNYYDLEQNVYEIATFYED